MTDLWVVSITTKGEFPITFTAGPYKREQDASRFYKAALPHVKSARVHRLVAPKDARKVLGRDRQERA